MFQGWAKFVHRLVNSLGIGYILNEKGKIEALNNFRFHNWINLSETWFKKKKKWTVGKSYLKKNSLVDCEFKATR